LLAPCTDTSVHAAIGIRRGDYPTKKGNARGKRKYIRQGIPHAGFSILKCLVKVCF
jgi:hypothetical protein